MGLHVPNVVQKLKEHIEIKLRLFVGSKLFDPFYFLLSPFVLSCVICWCVLSSVSYLNFSPHLSHLNFLLSNILNFIILLTNRCNTVYQR